MKEWKDGEERIWIKVLVIVPDNIQKGEKDVKSVENVEGNKEKIETNLVLKCRHRISVKSFGLKCKPSEGGQILRVRCQSHLILQ